MMIRVILSGGPHVWCPEYGWHDAATHGDEKLVTRDIEIKDDETCGS